jgi:HK97 family phage portal protein
MSFLDFFRRKESLARTTATLNLVGRAVSTPANYEGFARQGYLRNATVFSAISRIARSAGGVHWVLYKGKGKKKIELEEHPLLTLWNKPNPLSAQASFVEAAVAYFIIAGNSYIEKNSPFENKPPLELWNVQPDKMKLVVGPNGYPSAYQFKAAGGEVNWPVDPTDFSSRVMHWKTFHPTDLWYGMSPLEAAMQSLDQNNAGQKWNLSLLQNSATPSGVLQMKESKANPRGELTEEQYARLRAEFDDAYTGSKNAGRPLIIEGGLNWMQMSMSPKDMDFGSTKQHSATDIAVALGVPPELLGLGVKTFNNWREARLSFYEETVLPTLDSFRDNVNMNLTPEFGDGLYLDYDKDDIEALQWAREQKYSLVGGADYLTQNEKREAIGYDAKEGWDVFKIGNNLVEKPEDMPVQGGLVSDLPPSEIDVTDSTKPIQGLDPEAEARQATALNGAQVSSLLEVITSVVNGQLPRDSALNIIMVAFNVDQAQAEEILGDVGEGFEATPQIEGNAPPANPELEEEKEMSWKSFNLVNANERKKTWRAQNAKRNRLVAAFSRDIRDDYKGLSKKLEKVARELKNKDPKLVEFALLKTINNEMPEFARTISKHVRFTTEDFGSMIFREAKDMQFTISTKANTRFDSFVEAYVKRRTGDAIKSINSTSQKRVSRIVKEWVAESITSGDSAEELSKYLQLEFEDLSPGSAMNIARTEVGVASNNGSREAVKSLQIPNMTKEWVSAADDRVRDGENLGANHEAMNGVTVPFDEKFTVPPDCSMEGPGDPSAPADQVCNCRCVTVYQRRGN